MAKKQTRRSISVSRTTYERLKAFCEANSISMSQLVETRVNDFLGGEVVPATTQRSVPTMSFTPTTPRPRFDRVSHVTSQPSVGAQPIPMTSAAARFAVEPPPPIIKITRTAQEESTPKPPEKRADQIFTF